MDVLKRLKLEFDGIRKTIDDYTSTGNINNHLNQMEVALSDGNLEVIKYCLSELSNWYNKNISKIHSNMFCYNSDDHDRNKLLIDEIAKELQDYKITEKVESKEVDNMSPIIFLSHKSDDKLYGDALEKLIVGLGVKNNQLIYTTHPLHKIPLNENIYEYLRRNIHRKVFMIILWSDKYLESPSCLNEMGAAWVTQIDYMNIFVPDFSFGNPKFHECAVDTRKMGAVLNGDEHCKASMIEFKNKIQALFGLDNDEATSSYLLDQFNKEIMEVNSNG